MKRMALFIGSSIIVSCFACKKAPIDHKIFAERYLEGYWQVKATIFIDKLNGNTYRNDTLKIIGDTVVFTPDLKFWRLNTLVPFSVDNNGENIKFNTLPDSTWYINYMRKNEFQLLISKKDTLLSDVKEHNTYRTFTKINPY